jgi:segregation and condensation protein A
LGLLLYLIRKDEMDIMDINVHEITRQYLEYIRMMKELDLEVAGEFVAMAATLIHIKSRLLLPQYNDEGEVVEQEDPRKELVQKLLEYHRYQEAAKQLYDRPVLGRDVWASAVQFDFKGDDPGEIITEEEGLFSLVSSYRKAVKRMNRAVHNVRAKVQSIASRILEMKDRLIVGGRITLNELVAGEGQQRRAQVLITFLSLLELGRMGFVNLFQNETYGDIHVETKQTVERNVLERVQEFESEGAEDVASHLIDDARNDAIDEQGEVAQLAFEDITRGSAGSGDSAATDEEILAAEREMESLGETRVASDVALDFNLGEGSEPETGAAPVERQL